MFMSTYCAPGPDGILDDMEASSMKILCFTLALSSRGEYEEEKAAGGAGFPCGVRESSLRR
jgi:hypothetical protein